MGDSLWDMTKPPIRTKVYCLLDENGIIRYVGKTQKTLLYRLSEHVKESRSGTKTHKCNWVRSLLAKKMSPKIELLCEVDGNGCKEETSWIALFRSVGVKLTNGTDGGEGISGHKHSEETRKKLRESHIGHFPSEETKKKMGIAATGRRHSEETCRKMMGRKWSERTRLKMQQRVCSNETRRKMSIAQTGRKHSEESKQRMQLAHTGRDIPEETRRKISATLKGREVSQEMRQRISKTLLGRKKSEVTRQRIRDSWQKRRVAA